MEKTKAHIIVWGHVQGVFFRENTRKEAEKLGLLGWVKNLPDGTVEIVVEGEKEKIEQIIDFIKKNPGFSKVEDVKIDFEEPTDEFKEFEIRY